MTPIERERLRVWEEARLTVAQRVDPDDTMTCSEAIRGHEAEVVQCYRELVEADAVLAALEAR